MPRLLLDNLINKVVQLLRIHKNKQNYYYNKNNYKLEDIKVKIISKPNQPI